MSGGHFDYKQYVLHDIADQIQNVIDNNDITGKNEWGERIGNGYPPKVIEKFSDAILALKIAGVYAHRIDYLLSCDDGENTFLQRLADDLEALK